MAEATSAEEINDSNEISDYILSITWNHGILGAVYYNLDTMELTIVHEVIDTRPDFTYLNNLLRQICPSYFLINGPSGFTNEILQMLDIPTDTNRSAIYRRRNKPPTRSNIMISCIDKAKLPGARTKILKLQLPGMPENTTDSTRTYFLSSVLPLDQDLVLFSLANFLEYMEANMKHLLRENAQPIISNINICQLNDQLLIDLSTLYGLHIFSPDGAPNSVENKKQFNLFNLLNQCTSHMGSLALREIMMQPTRDLNELQTRHATIEWCLKSNNFELVCKFRQFLRQIRNLTILYRGILLRMGKAADFKSFKVSVYYAYMICEECSKLPAEEIKGTFLKTLADFMLESRTVKSVLFTLDKVIDLSESEKENRFVVKYGLDPALDEKKEFLKSIQKSAYDDEVINKLELPDMITDFYLIFLPTFGFIVSSEVSEPNLSALHKAFEGKSLEIIYRKDDTIYFKNKYCEELNLKYGHLYGEICCHEKRIFDRVIKYITESLPELIAINKMCAKLDCMIAFASVAIQRDYVRPQIVQERGIMIQKGRHPLIEIKVNFVPNDTDICDANKNLVTILSAQNATGKSAYMKEIALICYMAHIGSFVPASNAKIGVLDSIYTRIYCPESIHLGESSFLADVKQMSHVLLRGTARSLVLIDEFGKGTNIREGQALLASCIENMVSRGENASITIVSTHFYDVLKLIGNTKNVALKTIKTVDEGGKYRSLYEIVDGFNQPSISVYDDILSVFNELLRCNPVANDVDMDSVYSTVLAARFGFALTLINMIRTDKDLDMDIIENMFKQTNLSEFY